jgi:hypothetical protein
MRISPHLDALEFGVSVSPAAQYALDLRHCQTVVRRLTLSGPTPEFFLALT